MIVLLVFDIVCISMPKKLTSVSRSESSRWDLRMVLACA